jgi:hypothetical protein
LTLYPRRKV